MTSVMERLTGHADVDTGEFGVVSRYNLNMDFFLYLVEDCAYRADRVDGFLTVLWHPHEDRLVGLKLKGFRFLFNQLTKLTKFGEGDFVPLVNAIELAVVSTVTDEMLARVGEERLRARREKYDKALKFASRATISPDEWHKIVDRAA